MLEKYVEKDVNLLNLEGNPHNLLFDTPLLTREVTKLEREYENGVWLKHADFKTDLRKLQESHLPGTCEWFLRSDAYVGWLKPSANSTAFDLLWVQGKPGSGKSTLASQIIYDLQSRRDLVVAYIFCKDGEENKNDLQSILRNLVFQLLEKFSSDDKRFHTLVQNARLSEKSLFVQSIDIIWSMLGWMLRESNHVYCVLDGLDECNNSVSERASFLVRLTEVFKAEGHTAKLVVISRLDSSEVADKSSLWKCVQIQSSDVREDIERFTSTRLQGSRTLRTHPESDHLLSSLVDSSDGMILWTELMIEELEAGHWNVQRVLLKPPRGLSAIYASILHRISEAAPMERVQRALQLILAASRPLSLEELALGLAVTEGLCSHEEYDLRGNPTAEGREIVLVSNPLLMIMPDETVQLTHTSLKDYLLGSQAPPILPAFQFRIGSVHHGMALVLISYLSFQCFKTKLDNQMQEKCHLLEYASTWLVHHSTQTEDPRRTAEMLIAFFQIAQGWGWLQRLQETYKLSYGHLLLMQSQLKHWAQLADVDSEDRITLGGFLLVLARRRYEDMKASPIHNPSVLEAMASLSSAYRYHGYFSEAEELAVQVLETRKEALGAEHPGTLLGISNLASTYSSQGRWKEAEELEVQLLETREKVLGVEHPDTLTSMGNLASTYFDQGRWKEAEELAVQVLETRKKVLEAEHPDTLLSMGDLALTHFSQGRLKEAEELAVQVLETKKKVLGAEHLDTLLSMGNLASTYSYQGRWKEAEELEVQVLETRKKVLGVEHPITLLSISNLASTYFDQGRLKKAEKLEVQVLEMKKKVLGAEHPDTLTSMNNLAHTWRSLGKAEESINLMEQTTRLRREKLGPDHPLTKESAQRLSQWESEQQQATSPIPTTPPPNNPVE
jgi:tetratricopeptide (TPR) repeat protein